VSLSGVPPLQNVQAPAALANHGCHTCERNAWRPLTPAPPSHTAIVTCSLSNDVQEP
jgi:hypothetical protein